MKREINEINNTRASVSYHFDIEEISARKEKILNEYCSTVSIPGFRKGKVPRNIILSKFSADIESRTKSALLNESFEEVQKCEEELHLLTVVDFAIENKDSEIVCKLIYDVRPDIELPDYKNIELTSFSVEVTEEEIDEEFGRTKKQHSQYIHVDREVQIGDYVKVNYNGILEDGSEIAAVVPENKIWGKQVNTWEEAGNKDVPGVQAVIQGVIGHKKGDKIEGEEIFPEDFTIPMLAGKKATYNFEILEVRERVDPEINEEFLKQYHVSDISELKNKIKESISQHKRTQGFVKQRDDVVNFLSNSAEFELPESVLKHENQVLLQMFIDSQTKKGASVQDLEKHLDEISQNLVPMAIVRGKSGLFLDKIADKEKISIENNDLNSMILQDTMLKRIDVNQYINDLKKDRNLLIDLRTRTLRGKVLDFLVKLNSKKDTKEEDNTAEVTVEE